MEKERMRKTIGMVCLAGLSFSAQAERGLSAAAVSAATASRPNMVFIMADDMGYSDAGCYGGEIETPVLDRLAGNGLRFGRFYNTARCWPSRTALMTGYYPRQTNTDPLEKKASLPPYVRTLPAFLKPHGYRCYHAGKWHVRPGVEKVVADGRFDRSFNVLDYDRFFSPRKNTLDDVPLPVSSDPDYYDTKETVSRALEFLGEHRQQTPDSPFFLYLAFIAPHFPLHALQEDIDRYRDRYTAGWDATRAARYRRITSMGLVNGPLPERETGFRNQWGWTTEKLKEAIGPGETADNPQWGDLTDSEKSFQAHKMAIHAAMIDRMDREIGRLVAWLEQTGQLDNTLILFASDNGASSEQLIRGDGHDQDAPLGSAGSYLCLGPGWACTANTPFRYSKGYVHEGGIASPFIVHWPAAIKDRGAIRHTEGHLIDILPTLAAVAGGIPAGVRPADAPPLPGKNLLPAFMEDAAVPREELWFSHIGNRALRKDGWKAVMAKGGAWELYRMGDDRTETRNLASQYPERLQALVQRWETLDAQFAAQAEATAAGDATGEGETVFDGKSFRKLAEVPALTLANMITWRMEVNIDADCEDGAILMGNRKTPGTDAFFKITPSKGVQLYQNGRHLFRIDAPIPRGVWTAVKVVKEGARFTLYLDGKEAGSATMAEPVPAMPCYLGGDPSIKNFARCSIRNAAVENQ